ncbi:MAG: hypothetical protein GX616_24710, partial [Planctomycetes bacterium]|nr:hypothetical protein [Planctomycetota bacterium]
MILLTQPKAGRLLVGSGNLGLNGYASGGELFAQYDYGVESPEHLGAFLNAWDLVEGVWARGYIPGLQARRRLDHLFERTPWLMGTAPETRRPVRHNLTESFLDQLATAVGGRVVEELWVLSPFLDREAAALDQMLSVLQPRLAVILVQPKATSLDPTNLQRVLDRYPGMCEVRPVTRGDEIPYIHAKLYLAKLRDAAVCLQGSPNLSQVAMLLTGPQGNIELANLVEGPRQAFDHLIAALNVGRRVTSVSALDLSLEPISPLPAQLTLPWQLLAGEWKAEKLRLWYRGQRPDLSNGELLIARTAFPLEIVSQEDGMLQVRLRQESAGLLGRPVPVTVRWRQGDEILDTNPVFLCNQAALEQEIE